jgi:hypothetical protein
MEAGFVSANKRQLTAMTGITDVLVVDWDLTHPCQRDLAMLVKVVGGEEACSMTGTPTTPCVVGLKSQAYAQWLLAKQPGLEWAPKVIFCDTWQFHRMSVHADSWSLPSA